MALPVNPVEHSVGWLAGLLAGWMANEGTMTASIFFVVVRGVLVF